MNDCVHEMVDISLETKVGEERMPVGKVTFQYCKKCGEIDKESLNKACEEARTRYSSLKGGD